MPQRVLALQFELCSPRLIASRVDARWRPSGFRPGFWPQGQSKQSTPLSSSRSRPAPGDWLVARPSPSAPFRLPSDSEAVDDDPVWAPAEQACGLRRRSPCLGRDSRKDLQLAETCCGSSGDKMSEDAKFILGFG